MTEYVGLNSPFETVRRTVDGDHVSFSVSGNNDTWNVVAVTASRAECKVSLADFPRIDETLQADALAILRSAALRSVMASTASHLMLRADPRPWTLESTAELAHWLRLYPDNEALLNIANQIIRTGASSATRASTESEELELLPLVRVPRLSGKRYSLPLRMNSWLRQTAERWADNAAPKQTTDFYRMRLDQLESACLNGDRSTLKELQEILNTNRKDIFERYCLLFTPILLISDDSHISSRLFDMIVACTTRYPSLQSYLHHIAHLGPWPGLGQKAGAALPDPVIPPRRPTSLLSQAIDQSPQLSLKRKLQKQVDYWDQVLQTYVPLQGCVAGSGKHEDLLTVVNTFLSNSKTSVLLLHGDLGSGKTTFCRRLGQELLDKESSGYLPVFVNANRDITSEGRWENAQIEETVKQVQRNDKKPLLIIDSYDELTFTGNLFTSLQLDRWGPNLNVLIPGRPTRLGRERNYGKRFAPTHRESEIHMDALVEVHLEPFLDRDILRYLADTTETRQILGVTPHLRHLIRRPFALAAFAKHFHQISRRAIEKGHPVSTHRLLDQIVSQRLDREEQRLYARGAEVVDDIVERYELFNEALAVIALARTEDGVIEFSQRTRNTPDEDVAQFEEAVEHLCREALARRPDGVFQLEAPPFAELFGRFGLASEGGLIGSLGQGKYAFLDRSLMAYFGAKKLFSVAQGQPLMPDFFDQISLRKWPLVRSLLAEMVLDSVEKLGITKWLWSLLFVTEQAGYDRERVAGNAASILSAMRVSFSNRNMVDRKITEGSFAGAVLDGSRLEGSQMVDCDFNSTFVRDVVAPTLTRPHWGHSRRNNCRSMLVGSSASHIVTRSGEVVDLATNVVIFTDGRLGSCAAVSVSPSGRWIATITPESITVMERVMEGNGERKHYHYDQSLRRLAFSCWYEREEGYQLALSDRTQILHLDGEKPELLNAGTVCGLSYGADGNQLVWGTCTNAIHGWDRTSPPTVIREGVPKSLIATHSFGRSYRATGFASGEVAIYDEQGQPIHRWPAHADGRVNFLYLSDSQDRVLSVGHSHACLWDTLTGRLLWRQPVPRDGIAHASPNLDKLSIFDPSRHEQLITSVDLTLISLPVNSRVTAVAISDDSKVLASGHMDGCICLWAADRAQPLALHNLEGSVSAVFTASPMLVGGVAGNTLSIWNKGKKIIEKSFECRPVALANHATRIACGHAGGLFDVWQVQGEKLVNLFSEISGSKTSFTHVCFSPDGLQCAAAMDIGNIGVWNLDGKQLALHSVQGGARFLELVLRQNNQVVAVTDAKQIFRSQGNALVPIKAEASQSLGFVRHRNGKVSLVVKHRNRIGLVTEQGEPSRLPGVPIQGFTFPRIASNSEHLVLGENSLSLWTMSDKGIRLSWRSNPDPISEEAFKTDG